ncbi:MAG: MmcQ/YjbR family DNA-binding protein [Sodaliphilus sp.]
MDIEQVREYVLSLPGVTEDQPFGDDVLTFRVEGKIFMCLWLGFDHRMTEPRFACKLAPERNEALRERYAAITPAYHWNKRHWSDVCFNSLPTTVVQSLIAEAHRLIISTLPKRLRLHYE